MVTKLHTYYDGLPCECEWLNGGNLVTIDWPNTTYTPDWPANTFGWYPRAALGDITILIPWLSNVWSKVKWHETPHRIAVPKVEMSGNFSSVKLSPSGLWGRGTLWTTDNT